MIKKELSSYIDVVPDEIGIEIDFANDKIFMHYDKGKVERNLLPRTKQSARMFASSKIKGDILSILLYLNYKTNSMKITTHTTLDVVTKEL
jgi:hypothetical protein